MAKVVQCDICGKVVPAKQALEIKFTRLDNEPDSGYITRKPVNITGDYCQECADRVAELFKKEIKVDGKIEVIDSKRLKELTEVK